MTQDAISTREANAAPYGAGYIFPVIGSLALTLIWGAYTIWVSLEILAQHP